MTRGRKVLRNAKRQSQVKLWGNFQPQNPSKIQYLIYEFTIILRRSYAEIRSKFTQNLPRPAHAQNQRGRRKRRVKDPHNGAA